MVAVGLVEQQIFRHGTCRVIRLPFPQLQRHQRMASSVRLTSLSLPLQILCFVAAEKLLNELVLSAKFLLIHRKAVSTGGGECQNGGSLIVAGKAGPLLAMTDRSFGNQWYHFFHGSPQVGLGHGNGRLFSVNRDEA
jgi:hypothetical protein